MSTACFSTLTFWDLPVAGGDTCSSTCVTLAQDDMGGKGAPCMIPAFEVRGSKAGPCVWYVLDPAEGSDRQDEAWKINVPNPIGTFET